MLLPESCRSVGRFNPEPANAKGPGVPAASPPAAVFQPQDACSGLWLCSRLRRKVRNSPRPMKAKLKVARKHIPTISVFKAVAML